MEDTTPPEKSNSFNANKETDVVADPPEPDSAIESDVKPDAGEVDDNKPEIIDIAEEEKEKETEKDKHEEKDSSSSSEVPDLTLPQLSDEIDKFLTALSAVDENASPLDVPSCVEGYSSMVESMLSKYNSGEVKFGQVAEDDSSLDEALGRLCRLTDALRNLPPGWESQTAEHLNRTSSVVQRAMVLYEHEFRALLEDSNKDSRSNARSSTDSNHKEISSSKSVKTAKQSSFSAVKEEADRCGVPESPAQGSKEDEFPAYPAEAISSMNRIARAMISAGYEAECCQVYCIARRHAFMEALNKLGLDRISIDDVLKMQWESLNDEISAWIKVVKHCDAVLFPGEKKFSESVFQDASSSLSRSLYTNLARAVVIQLLNFAEAVAMTKRSVEKLFKFLDMYEALREMLPALDDSYSEECVNELKSELAAARGYLGEAAVGNFCDLENSIKGNTGKTPVPGGALHPLTRYTMNYLTYACEYKDTLEQIFLRHHQRVGCSDEESSESDQDQSEPKPGESQDNHDQNRSNNNNQAESKPSPFSVQLGRVMDLLDLNLESNSKLYKDSSLRNIFLMNNGRYILQKLKGSAEIHEVMGDPWCRKRSSDLRQYHKNYQRDTWVRVLGCLKDDGLISNGKVSKPNLKERFKSFNTMFEEIHRTQSTWVVSDEQLQSELRVSISALVIPAYRSFLGRFQQYLDPGRQTEKYIKLQPEDIETAIDELFDGNPTSIVRRRT